MLRFIMLFLPLFFVSCAPRCGYNYQMENAQEFVLDSYKIKEGKFSILEMEGKETPPLPASFLVEYEDQIDEDDVLKVAIFHPTRSDLTEAVSAVGGSVGFRVQNGEIKLPSLPPVFIKGLTLKEAQQKIQSLYDSEISSVQVFIEYLERRHSNVELTGAVGASMIPINGRTRLYEILSIAHISPSANLFDSYVLRGGKVVPVDLVKLMLEGDMSQNIVMRPKDKIFIAATLSSSVMVMGEVGMAQTIPIPSGSLSIRHALASAGGIPFTGNRDCILVIRGNVLCPKIYRLSWNHITYLPNDSLLLMPGDTIYISEKPITKWNRFIEQLIPSSVLFDLLIKTKGYCCK
ncbi:MAG: hypothetical protein S4CHLAM45_11980 [Chlamydiales bacterium]|nr:hypothetical protein [Chlamydiales bacterium]MCH9619687.1 hypothetical protein [Chlamydiales bacterium]MCH9623293.1 hypothetical protein [Chlamydiales bacterium]